MITMLTQKILKVALWSLILLIIPLALQFTIGTGVDGQGWNWKLNDFVIIGVLIFILGVVIEFIYKKFGRYRALGIAVALLAFLWLWAELAVGVFTNLGS